MCGIAGFTGHHDPRLLERMTGLLSHRGPDAAGHWSDPGARVAMGHRRLSIVDLSGGAQPMWTPDGGLGVVFNGEIYNHAELRADLVRLGAELLLGDWFSAALPETVGELSWDC
jgi:asparagine synthase (glutamine-hydrolysing)